MIIEIKIANYRSINAEQTFSFVAENATRHKDNLIPRKGYKLLKAAALFGANASGKSSLVKAIGAMRDFVRDSATRMNDGDPILAAEPFRLDPNTRCTPARFEITFLTNGLLYTYGFAADAERVYEEWLKAEPEGGRAETFGFQRTYDAKTDGYVYDCRGTLNSVADLLLVRTRYNALALSVGSRENVLELQVPYRFFRDHIQVYNMSNFDQTLLKQAAHLCKENEQLYRASKLLLSDADTGINDVSIIKTHLVDTEESEAPPTGSAARVSWGLDRLRISVSPPEITTSRTGTDGETVVFDFVRNESSGTQRTICTSGLVSGCAGERGVRCCRRVRCQYAPFVISQTTGTVSKRSR